MAKTYQIPTSHATIAVLETRGRGPALLMIHGNSACKEVFQHQIDHFGDAYRLIAVDLPGHGASSNAHDPRRTYSIAGYADCMREVLHETCPDGAAILGWSLGGHIGMEMVPRLETLHGLMISGSPPLAPGADNFGLGFRPNPLMRFTGQADLTAEEVRAYANANSGTKPVGPFLEAAVARTHGIARQYMIEAAVAETMVNERDIAETCAVPLAIVNGADDAFVNVDYFAGLSYKNLWRGRVFNLTGLGHAPFWEAPEVFNPLLGDFLEDLSGRH